MEDEEDNEEEDVMKLKSNDGLEEQREITCFPGDRERNVGNFKNDVKSHENIRREQK